MEYSLTEYGRRMVAKSGGKGLYPPTFVMRTTDVLDETRNVHKTVH